MLLEDILLFIWSGFESYLKHPKLFQQSGVLKQLDSCNVFALKGLLKPGASPLQYELLVDCLKANRDDDDPLTVEEDEFNLVAGMAAPPLPRKFLRLLFPNDFWDKMPSVIKKAQIYLGNANIAGQETNFGSSDLFCIANNLAVKLFTDIAKIVGTSLQNTLQICKDGCFDNLQEADNHRIEGFTTLTSFVQDAFPQNNKLIDSFNGQPLLYAQDWKEVCYEWIPAFNKQLQDHYCISTSKQNNFAVMSPLLVQKEIIRQLAQWSLEIVPRLDNKVWWKRGSTLQKKQIFFWHSNASHGRTASPESPLVDYSFIIKLVELIVDFHPKFKACKAPGELKKHCIYHLTKNDTQTNPSIHYSSIPKAQIIETGLFYETCLARRAPIVRKSDEELINLYNHLKKTLNL